MIERIVSTIPENLQEKIVILPHPLMQKLMYANEVSLSKYLQKDKTHDEVLRECRLLITDYSSIAFDAFYRGSNVIFYWEEKDECMERYGNGRLMLNEGNIFGDIAYTVDELKPLILKNYNDGQSELNISRFRNIVSFHDNKNSERLVNALIGDGLI